MDAVIGGRYRLLDKLGSGGDGEIYLAFDEKLARYWAIKHINHADGEREIKLLKSLDHRALPEIIECFKEDGGYYAVMDYIDGKNLRQLIDEGVTLPYMTVLNMALELCDVLGYLHNLRVPVIYRDMKPENIMFTSRGDVRLVDFGSACTKEEKYKIRDNRGTHGFAAPEQYYGVCDERSDIYSLGASVMAATGKKRMFAYPKLAKIIYRCMRYDPDRRFSDVFEVKYALLKLSKRRNFHVRYLKKCAIAFMITVVAIFSAGIVRFARGMVYSNALKAGNVALAASQGEYNNISYTDMVKGLADEGKLADNIDRVIAGMNRAGGKSGEKEELNYTFGEMYMGLKRYGTQIEADYEKAEVCFSSCGSKKYCDALAFYCQMEYAFSDAVSFDGADELITLLREYVASMPDSIEKIEMQKNIALAISSYREELDGKNIDAMKMADTFITCALAEAELMNENDKILSLRRYLKLYRADIALLGENYENLKKQSPPTNTEAPSRIDFIHARPEKIIANIPKKEYVKILDIPSDAVILSCTINGLEIPYRHKKGRLKLRTSYFVSGRNRIQVMARTPQGYIYDMKAWEIDI